MRHFRIIAIIAVALALVAPFWLIAGRPEPAASQDQSGLALRPPAFVAVAHAQSETGASFLEKEAGISAYAKLDTPVDLAKIKMLYRTIELETDTYVVGSVPVRDYPESEDVHLYASSDGWVVAYYLAADPAAKIFDWRAYHAAENPTITTKLEHVLALISDQLGLPPIQTTYYDFRFPGANQLMLVVEVAAPKQTDSFQLQVPSEFAVSERSWFVAAVAFGSLALDGTTLAEVGNQESIENVLTATQLRPDEFHTTSVSASGYEAKAYGGLALVYRDQP